MLSENDVRELLGAMCSRLGVCLTAGDVDRLASAPPDSVSAFVDAIVRAEWDSAGLENVLRAELEAMVADAVASRRPAAAGG
jgi:hypothetical protein